MKISVRTIQNWRNRPGEGDQRRGPLRAPSHKITDEERAQALAALNEPENSSLSPAQLVAKLADDGEYIISESSMYRILREEKLLKHRHPSSPPQEQNRPEGEATQPNQLWAWDITYLPLRVKGQFVYLYLCLDVFSRKIVGWSVEEREDGALAAALFEHTILREGAEGRELTLHSDNGAPMTSSTLKKTLDRLKVNRSLSRPGVSDDNAFSESLFRTLKYRPEYPKASMNLANWRAWVSRFVEWYNEEHLHSGISYVTPSQRHAGVDREILRGRRQVYRAAQGRNPRRWTRSIRSWARPEKIRLAPLHAA